MVKLTADDFAKARYAEHPDGAPYARADLGASYPWIGTVQGTICRFSDKYAAENGWRIVTPAPDPTDPDVIEETARRAYLAAVGDWSDSAWNLADTRVKDKYRKIAGAVLTPEPPRPEGAKDIEAILYGIEDFDGDAPGFADLLASRGVRVAGGDQ